MIRIKINLQECQLQKPRSAKIFSIYFGLHIHSNDFEAIICEEGLKRHVSLCHNYVKTGIVTAIDLGQCN